MLMESCMGDLYLTYCLLYTDDIVVYSRMYEEHLQRLEVIFLHLSANCFSAASTIWEMLSPQKVSPLTLKYGQCRSGHYRSHNRARRRRPRRAARGPTSHLLGAALGHPCHLPLL